MKGVVDLRDSEVEVREVPEPGPAKDGLDGLLIDD